MKLTTILTNDGELFESASDRVSAVDKLQDLIDGAVKNATEVLVYGTEFNGNDVYKLDKSLEGWHSFIREQDKTNTYRFAFASNPNVNFSDRKYLHMPKDGKLPTFNGVVVASENGLDSYVGTMQHLYPYAGGEKDVYGVLVNGNQYKFDQFKEGVIKARAILEKQISKVGSSHEFHTGYYDMYGSIFWNLLLKLGKTGQILQDKFISLMSEYYNLYPVGDLENYTYETHKFGLPIQFKGVHTFVEKGLKESTEIDIIPPQGNSGRATVVSRMEW